MNLEEIQETCGKILKVRRCRNQPNKILKLKTKLIYIIVKILK